VLGGVYKGKVTGIMEFGCFVELQGFPNLGKKVSRAGLMLWHHVDHAFSALLAHGVPVQSCSFDIVCR
jgi:predicted RNA-binding protein with RPS1 domain